MIGKYLSILPLRAGISFSRANHTDSPFIFFHLCHHSGLNGRASPSVVPPGTQPNSIQQVQQRQTRGGSPNTSVNTPNPTSQPSPSQTQPAAQSAPQQGQQQQQQQQPPPQSQQRPAFPWSQRRLLLPPPVTLLKPGIAPPSSPSPSPFPRYGHALPANATATGELFLFGGLVRESVRNDLYLFSTRDLSATLLQTAGEVPSPRVGHASALVGSVLIVWGGDTKTNSKAKPGDKQDDGLYLLNLGALNQYFSLILEFLYAILHSNS